MEFIKNQGNIRKIIEHHKYLMSATPNNKLYGYLKYEKNREMPLFKINDIITKGITKSIGGITCTTRTINEIKKTLNKLDDKVLKTKHLLTNTRILCNDIEILMKHNDNIKLDGKKWYYTPEEYEIYFSNL